MRRTAPSQLFATCSITALLALTGAAAADAQSAPSAPAAPETSAGGPAVLGEVVVTARRRNERLQDVPVAVTAISPKNLDQAQVVTARQLVQFVPSLNVGTGNMRDFQRFTIRGQGTTVGAGEGVTAYMNEAPFPQFGAGGPGFYYDMQNVQVLNGPQGTLFGRNTTGGAVLFTPNPPTDRNEGSLQVGYGNYNNREVTGVLNWAAIPDVLDIRFSGTARARDGFTHSYYTGDQYDNVNYQAYRLSIRFKPTSKFQNDLVLSYNHDQTAGTSFNLVNVNPSSLVAGLAYYLPLQNQIGPRETLATGPHFWLSEDTRAVDTATYQLNDNILFKNIVSWDRERIAAGFDFDGTPAVITQWQQGPYTNNPSAPGLSQTDYLTEEFQIQLKALDGHLNWVNGGFYEHYYPTDGFDGEDINEGGTVVRELNAEQGDSKALFTQATLDLGYFTPVLDRLKLTAGYRYTWDAKRFWSNQYLLTTGVCFGQPNLSTPNCAVVYPGSWNAPTFIAGLDYKVLSNLLVYGKVSSGYKSGGFNVGAGPETPYASFGPEYVKDYEAGVKTDFHVAGAPVRLDLALFHDFYSKIQRDETFPNPILQNAVLSEVFNICCAKINGIELEGQTKLGPFDVDLNYSWLQSAYTQTLPAASITEGNPLPYAPTNKIGGSVTYHVPVNPQLGAVSINVSGNYQSSFRWGDPDQVGNILGNYALFNLGANWDHINGRPIDFEFYMTNVLNRVARAGALDYYEAVGTVAVSYIEPRMVGFRVKYDFGQ